MKKTLIDLKPGQKAKISNLKGGFNFQQKLASLNIRPNKTIKKIVQEPFGGPIVIEIDNRKITLGRGMAAKIFFKTK